MMIECPVPGCGALTPAAHICDPLDRHAFDGPEPQGVQLAASVRPMDFGNSNTWIWFAFRDRQMDQAHQAGRENQ